MFSVMNPIRLALCSGALLVFAGSPVTAKVYKSVQPDGTVVYSDSRPDAAAEEVKLPEIQFYSAPPLPAPAQEEPPAEAADEGYSRFEIAAPADDATVRDNGGTVRISLAMEPPLQDGHEVEIFVNGASVGRGRATSASLTNVDRGSHTVYAVVRDGSGQELARTGSSTFHLKRATRLLRPGG
jgi:hypothetical protein